MKVDARMLAKILAALLVLCAAVAVHAALLGCPTKPIPPDRGATRNGGAKLRSMTTATDGVIPRIFENRAASAINMQDFGAKCDGSTDDSGAINAAINAEKSMKATNGLFSGASVGRCVIRHTIGIENKYYRPFTIDFSGLQLICQVSDAPCVDATGLSFATIRSLNILGSCVSGSIPNIGLLISRPSATAGSAVYDYLDAPIISGCFTLTPFYHRSAEAMQINRGNFTNYQAGGYAYIADGSNHFGIQSALSGATYAPNTMSSDNSVLCVSCAFRTIGANGIPMWLGGTSEHKFIRGYAASFYSNGGPAVVVYTTSTVPNQLLDLDLHVETNGLGSAVRFDGDSNIILADFAFTDFSPFQSGPLFARGVGVSLVTLQGATIKIGGLAGNNPSWFDSSAGFAISGQIFNQDGTYSAPGVFSGRVCVATTCTSSDALGNISATSIAATSVGATTVSASTVQASTVSNPGAVASITNLTPTGALSYWRTYTLAGSLPSPVITPSDGNGGGAAAVLTSIVLGPAPTLSGGAGCSVGDTFKLIDPQVGGGLVGGGDAIYTATAVSSGAVTATSFSASSGNAYLWNKPFSSSTYIAAKSSTCTTLPSAATSGGYIDTIWLLSNTGGGLKAAVSLTAGGSGYTALPTVGVSPAFSSSSAGGGGFSVTLNSTMITMAGCGLTAYTSLGTLLGISGGAGCPVVARGALIDNSGVRTALTIAGYTVPMNTSLVRFTQANRIASATIALPKPLADGQAVQFVNYAGAVTALTFLPVVNGWTNGAQLAANTGLRVRWDAAASAWYREQ